MGISRDKFSDFCLKALIILKGNPENWIVRILIIFGVFALSEPWWLEIVDAFLKKKTGITYSRLPNSPIGWALIIIGLLFFCFVKWEKSSEKSSKYFLFPISLTIIVIIFIYLIPNYCSNPKNKPEPVKDSIAVALPYEMSINNAIEFLAQIDGYTVIFNKCDQALLSTIKVKEGEMMGARVGDLIDNLKYRLINPKHKINYDTNTIKERGLYEITCKE